MNLSSFRGPRGCILLFLFILFFILFFFYYTIGRASDSTAINLHIVLVLNEKSSPGRKCIQGATLHEIPAGLGQSPRISSRDPEPR